MSHKENQKLARTIAIIAVLCIIIALVGYWAGRREGTAEAEPIKREADSLRKVNKTIIFNYNSISDSLKNRSEVREPKIDIIHEIKIAIRNEISKNNKKINALLIPRVQLYVDSIRSAGGFN